jgi:hypothetical protein
VSRKRVARLMDLMGIEAVYPKPKSEGRGRLPWIKASESGFSMYFWRARRSKPHTRTT